MPVIVVSSARQEGGERPQLFAASLVDGIGGLVYAIHALRRVRRLGRVVRRWAAWSTPS